MKTWKLCEQKEIKLLYKQNFVENKTNYAACLRSAVNLIVA
jgi:hypothetical protein